MPDCINRRLLLAILRAPSTASKIPFHHRIALGWARNITSSSSRSLSGAPGVSFGAENDALLAPYLERLKDKEKKAVAAEAANPIAKEPARLRTANTDSFEISEYVDRSADKSRNVDTQDETVENSRSPSDGPSSTTRASKRLPLRKVNGLILKRVPAARSSQRTPALSEEQSPIIRKIAGGEDLTPRSDFSEARDSWTPKKLESWAVQKNALREKFGDQGWQPRKKLSPDAMEGIRNLHEQDPFKYNTPVLAEQFKVSAEAIRRILKSKWSRSAPAEKLAERRDRWAKRHDRIWDQQAELGLRPQRVKEKELEDPDQFEKDMARKQTLGEM